MKRSTDKESRWLLIHRGDDNRPHVMYRPEANRHTARASCPCGTRIEAGVVLHTMLTSSYKPARPMRGVQFEH